MDNLTNPISASTAGNLLSQQAINSNRLRDHKNSQTSASDSTSDVIGDTLETSEREADGRQPFVIEAADYDVVNDTSSKKTARQDSTGPGNSLDVLG